MFFVGPQHHCGSCQVKDPEFRAPRKVTGVKLSTREKEVVRDWLLGETKEVTAKRLYISVGTLNSHLYRVRRKYERAGRAASSKVSLLARAIQDGIISCDELINL